jgi:very-short-patch-repair endonuclease
MRHDPILKMHSRGLRKEATPAEGILWGRLRARRFAQFKFRRQYVWGRFIFDFYCPAVGLVVELDGETHVGKEARDQARQAQIEAEGMEVLRFRNPQVYEDLDTVLELIWHACVRRSQTGPLTRR